MRKPVFLIVVALATSIVFGAFLVKPWTEIPQLYAIVFIVLGAIPAIAAFFALLSAESEGASKAQRDLIQDITWYHSLRSQAGYGPDRENRRA